MHEREEAQLLAADALLAPGVDRGEQMRRHGCRPRPPDARGGARPSSSPRAPGSHASARSSSVSGTKPGTMRSALCAGGALPTTPLARRPSDRPRAQDHARLAAVPDRDEVRTVLLDARPVVHEHQVQVLIAEAGPRLPERRRAAASIASRSQPRSSARACSSAASASRTCCSYTPACRWSRARTPIRPPIRNSKAQHADGDQHDRECGDREWGHDHGGRSLGTRPERPQWGRSTAPTGCCLRSDRDGRHCLLGPGERRRAAPRGGPRDEINGGDLLSQGREAQVPSALRGLTALFGMGRGVAPSLSPPKWVETRPPPGA